MSAPSAGTGSRAPLVRPATASDVPALLRLMSGLAEYERYADRFAVTEEVLRDHGFDRSPPSFHAVVAEGADGELHGVVVYYYVPFTITARPTLYVKELFVAPDARGSGIGELLLRAVAREAVAYGCGMVKWQVARWNTDAMRFYERLGARADDEWVDFQLTGEALHTLGTRPPST